MLLYEFIAILIISLRLKSFVIYNKNLYLLLPFLSLVAVSIIRMMPSFSAIASALTHITVYKNSYNIVMDEIFLFLKNDLIKRKNGSQLTEAKNINDKNIGDVKDELYDKAVDIVQTERRASTSFLQRKLQIGYNRAARIMETMVKKGIVGQANHVGKREIL